MCKNPSLYNPVRHNERTRGRRNVVLEQMRKGGYITEAECDSLKQLPLTLRYRRVDHKEGLATYFREYLRGVMTAKEPKRSDYRGWQMQKYYEDLWHGRIIRFMDGVQRIRRKTGQIITSIRMV